MAHGPSHLWLLLGCWAAVGASTGKQHQYAQEQVHGCPTGMPSGPLLPVSANASSCYTKDPTTRHPTLAGRWMSNGGPPQWVSFTLQLPRADAVDAYGPKADNSTPVLLMGLTAEGGACGDGNISASTSVYVCADDTEHSCTLVSTCHGSPPPRPGHPSSKVWGWRPPEPVRAHRVLLNTTVVGDRAGPYCCEGWVSLASIQFFACGAPPAPPTPLPPAPAPPASSFPRLITVGVDASPAEEAAAQKLARVLNNITGTGTPNSNRFAVQVASRANEHVPQFAVGPTAAMRLGLPADKMAGLGTDGYAMLSYTANLNGSAILTGGKDAPRGTLYAVVACLEALGVQFLAFDVTILPTALPTSLPEWTVRSVPAMMMRQAYSWTSEMNSDLNVHLKLNKGRMHSDAFVTGVMDAKHGSSIYYASPPGFVHTSILLLSNGTSTTRPPADLWEQHREWFWPRDDAHGPNGNATGTQICWSNTSLQTYMLIRAKECLRHDPGASIISISQLDNSNYCQDEYEAAIIAEEQSPAGPILRAVNFIADGLKHEFPDVLVSTLAYSYSRPVPVVTRPAKNVVVRFCTSSFDKDLVEAWSNITSNLFVWDYLTDFGAYMLPFPITFELGKDIAFLAEHGVRGYFGEMDFQGPGSDMSELNTYLLSKLLWDPTIDVNTAIATFLQGFYGDAAEAVMEYLSVLHGEVVLQGYEVRRAIWTDVNTDPKGYLQPATVLSAASAFQRALSAVEGPTLMRVQQASMPIYWTLLHRYVELRSYAMQRNLTWPVGSSLIDLFVTFSSAFNATTARWGIQPSLGLSPKDAPWKHSCTNPLNGSHHCDQLPLLVSQIFTRCPHTNKLADQVAPLLVNASSSYMRDPVYAKGPSVSGLWWSNGGPPGWIEFVLANDEAPAVAFSLLTAVNGSAGGEYQLVIDGATAHSWEPSEDAPLVWQASGGVVMARLVRLVTISLSDKAGPGCCVGWVGWKAITLLHC